MIRRFLRRLLYKLYLRTAHWQRVRKAALKRARYACAWCGKRAALDVHHLRYGNLWHEAKDDVKALCPRCHDRAHAR